MKQVVSGQTETCTVRRPPRYFKFYVSVSITCTVQLEPHVLPPERGRKHERHQRDPSGDPEQRDGAERILRVLLDVRCYERSLNHD